MRMRIDNIADHLDLIDTIARWHWNEWGDEDPGGSLASWTANLRRFTNRDRIPTIYVALDGDELLGSVSLVEHDMSTHCDLTPWLSGTFVKPERRGQGVASALVRQAVHSASEMGISRLYLYTYPARGLYEKLGWQPLVEDEYEGHTVTIMAIDTAEGA